MYVCMYVCMYVRTYVCVCMHVSMNLRTNIRLFFIILFLNNNGSRVKMTVEGQPGGALSVGVRRWWCKTSACHS